MAYKKTQEEIRYIIDGGKILGEVLEKLENMAVPGVSTLAIDQKAEALIIEAGGRPAFKGYRGSKHDPKFPNTICASVNDEIVHGVSSEQKVLKDGDFFKIDIGMQWPVNSGLGEKGNGFFTDTALSIAVGTVDEKTKKLMEVTKESLEKGIEAVKVGGTIADIGRAVQDYVAPHGYGVVRDLVGHGVGHAVHEEPRVTNYYDRALEAWKIEPGVVIAIEPMITLGDYNIKVDEEDGWTIRTTDGSLAGHYEHTIAVTEDGPVVVTRRPGECI